MKKVIIIVVAVIIGLIAAIAVFLFTAAPDMISSAYYQDIMDENDIDESLGLTYVVGEDIEPGLYTVNVSSLLTEAFGLDKYNLGNAEPIIVKIHKERLDYDFNVKLVAGNSYKNIELEEGDYITEYATGTEMSVLTQLEKQDELVQYDAENLQAGFYVGGETIDKDYDDSSFSTSANTLFRKNGDTYKPRAFYPVKYLEQKVSINDGDVIFIESSSLLNSDIY